MNFVVVCPTGEPWLSTYRTLGLIRPIHCLLTLTVFVPPTAFVLDVESLRR